MHYHLSFHDSDGRIEDVCEADLATGDIAIRWMQIEAGRGLGITTGL
jgi:hypothetical protein